MVHVWHLLFAFLLALAGAAPTVTPTVTATDIPTPLPASARICTAASDKASFAQVRAGVCPFPTTRTPADVFLHVHLPPRKEELIVFSSDLFAIKSGQLAVSVSGAEPVSVQPTDPLRSRPFPDGRLAVPITPSPTEESSLLIRLRIRDQRQLVHPERLILLLRKPAAIMQLSTRWLGQGAFLGLMLIMAVYHLFLWWAERLPAAVWYSLTLLTIGLYFSVNRNLFPLLPLDFAPRLALVIHPGLGPLFGSCFLQFVRKYAHLSPAGDRVLKGLFLAMAFCVLGAPLLDHAGFPALAASIVNGLATLAILVAIATTLWSGFRGDRASLIVAGATIPSMIGIMILIGTMSGILPSNTWADAAMQLGVTMQVSLLGLALSDRIRRLRLDRDQAEAIVKLTLPDVIAGRLKAGEKFIADRHSHVAVLFADLAGFTPLSASHDPETIVRLLDALFREMDALAHAVGAEKIKTIGDCYMVVAGAPSPHADPVSALADLAMALPQATARVMQQVRHLSDKLPERLSLRVGIHVGPVIAGVLREQKLAYDLWGDTVNTASRMESHGVVDRIQVSQRVVELLSDRYLFESRGEITVRGKGTLPVWFLIGKRGSSPSM